MYKHPDQRVGVFVDTANMYHSAKNLYKANVNFGEVLQAAVAGRRLVRAIAYVIKSDNDEENTFFDALSKQGFEVKQKDLQVFSSGMKKADWDVGLAIDAVKLADRLDAIILVSGDGDYIPLSQYLRENKGCLVEVAAFSETTSSKLREQADDFIDLSADTDRFLIGGRRRPSRAGGSASKIVSRVANAANALRPSMPDDSDIAGDRPSPKRKRRVIF